MSMREIIYNIEELEEFTNKTVDQEVLLDLLQKCPIDLTIPLTIKLNAGQYLPDDSDAKFDRNKKQGRIIADIRNLLPRKSETPRHLNRMERESDW